MHGLAAAAADVFVQDVMFMAKIDEIMHEIDYRTFIRIIDTIPSCIFFKDTDLRYRFSTHFWEQLQSDDILGKTDLEIRKDKGNALVAMETDREIIRSGKGCSYIIKSDVDGSVSYLELIKQPVFEDDGKVIGIVGLINDVTENMLMNQELQRLSTTDTLTGLANRKLGTDLIISRLEDAKTGALCFMDLNRFKSINDRFGHQTGDEVIRSFGEVLETAVSDSDVAMRLGGDEFMVFLNDVSDKEQAEEFARSLSAKTAGIVIPGYDEKLTVSIGIKILHGGESFDELYSAADGLMYQAKSRLDGFVIE